MAEIRMDHMCGSECPKDHPQCAGDAVALEGEAKAKDSAYDEATFAVLIAMVPLLVFTLFGQVGLL